MRSEPWKRQSRRLSARLLQLWLESRANGGAEKVRTEEAAGPSQEEEYLRNRDGGKRRRNFNLRGIFGQDFYSEVEVYLWASASTSA